MEERKQRTDTRRGVIAAVLGLSLWAFAWVSPPALQRIAPPMAPATARADLFGDIGVLLAQLEQQLQLVSNAIATVQNLVATVERLGKVVKYSETLLKQAGNGGVDGVLSAAQGFLGIARGVTGSLTRINNDAKWWTNKVNALYKSDQPMSNADFVVARKTMVERDRLLIDSAESTYKAYSRLEDSYKAMEAQGDAVQEAMRTEGVVGQMQLVGRQTAQLARIALHQDEVATIHSKTVTDDMMRQAEERRLNMERQKKAFDGFNKTNTSNRADLPYEIGKGWGWNDHE